MSFRSPRLALVFFLLLQALPAAAQTQPIDVTTSVEYTFGAALAFRAKITAAAPVARASLFYRAVGAPETVVLLSELSAGPPATAVASQDLRARPLIPFAAVEYWWQVDLADGQSSTTVPATFLYEDNRFAWQALRSLPVTVSWASGDTSFGQQALDLAVLTLEELERDLASPAPPALRIYIYPSQADLQTGLQLAGRTWSGAHAEPTLGVVLLAFGPQNLADLERSLPHELTHVVLAQRLGEAYASLPAWLGEGLATLQEPSPDAAQRLALEQAAHADSLLPIASLCSAFPVSADQALLAYAQSASLVQYLRDVYGSGSMAALLDAHAEGASCLGALERVYRRAPDQLFEEWQRSALGNAGSPSRAAALAPWSALLVPILLLLVAAGALRVFALRAPGARGDS